MASIPHYLPPPTMAFEQLNVKASRKQARTMRLYGRIFSRRFRLSLERQGYAGKYVARTSS